MRIAFCWDWINEPFQLITWRDGLAAALRIISKEHELKIYTQMRGAIGETVIPHDYFNIYTYPDYQSMQIQVVNDKPDVVLFWADMTRPAIDHIATKFPSAICFAGGDPTMPKSELFKKIFVESADYHGKLEAHGHNVEIAFGANTDMFVPKSQPRVFDAFFPACFAAWKRHDLFAKAVEGLTAMACGWYQAHEPWCYEACEKGGVFTTKHMPGLLLPDFYNAAKTIVITSQDNGGSQRSVLEAMACNRPTIVMRDSKKTSEYLVKAGYGQCVVDPDYKLIRDKINELKDTEVSTRQWVVDNYSEHTYSQKIIKGLQEICS